MFVRVDNVEKPLTVDEIIRETRECRETVELCLKAGIAVQSIASYQPQEFLRCVRRFKKFLRRIRRIQQTTKKKRKVPKWRHEELLLVLCIDKNEIEFRNPRPPSAASRHQPAR
jgi:hypothetical protein